jgi:hypothetical protein
MFVNGEAAYRWERAPRVASRALFVAIYGPVDRAERERERIERLRRAREKRRRAKEHCAPQKLRAAHAGANEYS